MGDKGLEDIDAGKIQSSAPALVTGVNIYDRRLVGDV